MDPARTDDHFDHLSTCWTLLGQAHDNDAAPQLRDSARRQLIQRYEVLVRRYLCGALREQRDGREAVDDCFQEFCLRMMRGAFKGADRDRGRFRYYLRVCLVNLVNDYRRRRRLPSLGDHDPEAPQAAPLSEQEFTQMWREELIARALGALQEHEKQSGQWLYPVLKLKMEQPELRSEQIAEQLSGQLGKPLKPEWARKRLFLARNKLAELLLEEVKQSLRSPTEEEVYEELADLGLLEYCRSALPRGRSGD